MGAFLMGSAESFPISTGCGWFRGMHLAQKDATYAAAMEEMVKTGDLAIAMPRDTTFRGSFLVRLGRIVKGYMSSGPAPPCLPAVPPPTHFLTLFSVEHRPRECMG